MTAGESQPLAVVEARIIEIVVIIVAVIDDIIEIGAAGSALIVTFNREDAKFKTARCGSSLVNGAARYGHGLGSGFSEALRGQVTILVADAWTGGCGVPCARYIVVNIGFVGYAGWIYLWEGTSAVPRRGLRVPGDSTRIALSANATDLSTGVCGHAFGVCRVGHLRATAVPLCRA